LRNRVVVWYSLVCLVMINAGSGYTNAIADETLRAWLRIARVRLGGLEKQTLTTKNKR
jgi:hypothetical protein